MHIRITGSPDNASRRTAAKAVRFYCGKIGLHPTTYQNLRLHIVFKETVGYKASLEWLDRRTKARSFKMEIRKSMSEDAVLGALAHETVHIRQYASGQMTDMANHEDLVRWEDELYEFEDTKDSELYWLSPWEIEARGYELGLLKLFKASLKK